MNIKVVIVWAFGIVIFAGLGIFGLMNQDLLSPVDNGGVYIPSDSNNVSSKTCEGTLAYGISAYRFQMNEQNMIDKVIMTYTSINESIDAYTAASNINNATINGVSTVMTGGINDFVLIVTVDLANYDRVNIENIRNDLNTLSMIVDSITDYEAYKSAISGTITNATYNCD